MYLYHYCVIFPDGTYSSGAFQIQSPINSPQAYNGAIEGLARRMDVDPGEFAVLSLSLIYSGERA